MTRVQIRENTFKLLFCKEFHDVDEMDEQCRLYFDEIENITEEDKEYITERVNSIVEKTDEIDKKINDVSVGWSIDRMGKVELTILRLAYYEMEYDEEVPKKVAIDQAIELGKKYGSDSAPGFINGILAKLY